MRYIYGEYFYLSLDKYEDNCNKLSLLCLFFYNYALIKRIIVLLLSACYKIYRKYFRIKSLKRMSLKRIIWLLFQWSVGIMPLRIMWVLFWNISIFSIRLILFNLIYLWFWLFTRLKLPLSSHHAWFKVDSWFRRFFWYIFMQLMFLDRAIKRQFWRRILFPRIILRRIYKLIRFLWLCSCPPLFVIDYVCNRLERRYYKYKRRYWKYYYRITFWGYERQVARFWKWLRRRIFLRFLLRKFNKIVAYYYLKKWGTSEYWWYCKRFGLKIVPYVLFYGIKKFLINTIYLRIFKKKRFVMMWSRNLQPKYDKKVYRHLRKKKYFFFNNSNFRFWVLNFFGDNFMLVRFRFLRRLAVQRAKWRLCLYYHWLHKWIYFRKFIYAILDFFFFLIMCLHLTIIYF
jgi:hypothetical protein